MGHVCAGFLAAQSGNSVSLLTRRPVRWSNRIDVTDCAGKRFAGMMERVSDAPVEVVPDAEMVLLCLPGYAIEEELRSIAPYLAAACYVGSVVSSTGFFFKAFEVLPKSQPLFGFQRVPFISRITRYGREAELKGYKESLSVAVEQTEDKEKLRQVLESLFLTPVELLASHYEAGLSNSNPLLHTARLYAMWSGWERGVAYERNPGFYSEWTVEASELYIAMDREFQQLLKSLGLREGCIPPVLEYYESADAESLTRKISNIPAFQGICSPMVERGVAKYEPDFTSRYFTEDFLYGLRFVVETGEKLKLDMPAINKVYEWGVKCLKEQDERQKL